MRAHYFILFLSVPSQDGGCVCQVSVCARTAGQVIAAVVPSPQKLASRPTACCAAGKASVCVANVRVMTLDTLEISARDALLAKSPASHTGTFHFLFPTKKHDGDYFYL